ncbi:MAG: Zn-ribbon domain-containing OB-fold protein [Candidatus Methanofastidiosia archaeon]
MKPYLLDFYPLQGEKFTRIHTFFENLKKGRFTTTQCKNCGEILWQPRLICPHCNSGEMKWVELPKEGKLYAFTQLNVGVPMGFEKDLPYCVGVVELENKLKILTRIDGASYDDLKIGMALKLKIFELEDGRVWFRFERK